MISSPLPRWPDRDAAGPGATFPLTVRCEEQTTANNDIKMTPLPEGAQLTSAAAWQTDWRGGMAVWPDEFGPPPFPAGRSWWPIIGVTLFAAGNAAIWIIGMASLVRRIIEPGAPFP